MTAAIPYNPGFQVMHWFVDSIIEKEQFQFYHFTPGISWCDKVLSILQQMSLLEKNKTEFYVYEVLVLLSSLWLVIGKSVMPPPAKQENVINMRMQKFLKYIEQYYWKDLSLQDLAKSANVSKSECLRCFKLSMQTTPYKYLIEFRLSKAAELLKKSDDPIGNIALNVGFHQMSHFEKYFKEKTGYFPRAYRNRNNTQ